MAENTRRRNLILVGLAVIIVVAALLLLLTRCRPEKRGTATTEAPDAAPAVGDPAPATSSTPPDSPTDPEEVLGEATLGVPARVAVGSAFPVVWTGPNNDGDYITVVEAGTPDGRYGNYTNTTRGSPPPLLLPVMEGEAVVRYMTGRGNRVLARRGIRIVAARVELSAAPEAAAGGEVVIAWTGPNNSGDYITIVVKGAPEGAFGDYRNTSQGSPIRLKAPMVPGEAEIRYVAGQGSKVLARIPIRIVR